VRPVSNTGGGRGPWGADTPRDESEARARLLDAAERCYVERGVSQTRMVDIARAAGVHRSTVYTYFPSRDTVRAAFFVRAMSSVLDAAEPCFHTDEPFLDQLVRAVTVGLDTARNSPTMRLLIAQDQAGQTYRAASTSENWRKNLVEGIGQRIAAAIALGEVRDDVSAEAMALWVTRIAFSLVGEPGRPEEGGDEGILRGFLARALSPRHG
jgi:AcrR family transcriptional regulator